MVDRTASASGPAGAGRTGALIVGGAHGSLGIARSLGRRGIPVWFLTSDHPITSYSRYTERFLTWRGPGDGGSDFLLELARRHGLDGWMLIAGGDSELRFISQQHSALSTAFRVAVPTWETARWAHDKHLTYQRAAALGIDHPRCYHPQDRKALAELDCTFPVLLKPAVREQQNAFTRAKAWRADDAAMLMARFDEAAKLVGERAIVLQELIPGGGSQQFSYAGVWDRGAPLASLVARRSRQYPVDFGYTSTFVETVEQPEIEAAATRFLRSIDYSGLVEVEFKHDERDGRYKLLDVNARVWTWSALGAGAGVDFADILWRAKMGESVPQVRARPGVAWRHGSHDLLAVLLEVYLGRLSPLQLLKSWRRASVFAAFAKDDPLPGLVDLPLVASRILAPRVRRLARRAADALRVPSALARLRALMS